MKNSLFLACLGVLGLSFSGIQSTPSTPSTPYPPSPRPTPTPEPLPGAPHPYYQIGDELNARDYTGEPKDAFYFLVVEVNTSGEMYLLQYDNPDLGLFETKFYDGWEHADEVYKKWGTRLKYGTKGHDFARY